jgi:hypothetical protein
MRYYNGGRVLFGTQFTQQLIAPTFGVNSAFHNRRAGKTNRVRSERWTFLCINNRLRGTAQYEATFRDIYGRSLEAYCNSDLST